MVPLTAQERLTLIRVKVERAKKHLDELQLAEEAFFRTHPHIIKLKINAETREHIYYVESVRGVPLQVRAIIGDVLNNTRSALDHLAYHLVVAAGGTPTVHTSFPIFDSSAKYKTDSVGKVKGMRQDAIEAIDAIKPYKGGNDTLWRLHTLNNIDKHRLLITVSTRNVSRSITPREEAEILRRFRKPLNLSGMHMASPVRSRPVKAGDHLLTIPESEVKQNMEFRFHIAFAEPQVIEGYSVVVTLKEMANLVDSIISSFAPLLE